MLAGCLKLPPSGTQATAPVGASTKDGEVVSPARKVAGLYSVGELRAFSFT